MRGRLLANTDEGAFFKSSEESCERCQAREFEEQRCSSACRPLGSEAEADLHATNVLPIIRSILSHGPVGMDALAEQLNQRGIRTARGGAWHVSSVANLLARAKAYASNC